MTEFSVIIGNNVRSVVAVVEKPAAAVVRSPRRARSTQHNWTPVGRGTEPRRTEESEALSASERGV